MKRQADGQLSLEFRSPEELAESARCAKEMAEWLNTPSPPPPPPLPPLPGWDNVVPGQTVCEIVRSRLSEDIGKVVVIRKVTGNQSVWASAADEPAVYRKNTKGRWVCEWDPMSAQRPFSMGELRILPAPWAPKPPVYRW